MHLFGLGSLHTLYHLDDALAYLLSWCFLLQRNVPLVTGWSSVTADGSVGPCELVLKELIDPSGVSGL